MFKRWQAARNLGLGSKRTARIAQAQSTRTYQPQSQPPGSSVSDIQLGVLLITIQVGQAAAKKKAWREQKAGQASCPSVRLRCVSMSQICVSLRVTFSGWFQGKPQGKRSIPRLMGLLGMVPTCQPEAHAACTIFFFALPHWVG